MGVRVKNIAVFGGNGFLGRKICESAVKEGHHVTSFSRSGKPPGIDPQWAQEVQWKKVDIFNPESYRHHLKDKDAVVHSIGILFENSNYKKSMNSNFDILNDIQNLASSIRGTNPMEKNSHQTYEAIQRDSAVMLADTYLQEHPHKPTFVYISADIQIPIVPSRYLETKREAEFELSCKKGLRTIIMRPGFMYDEAKKHFLDNRNLIRLFLTAGYDVKESIFGESVSYLNSLVKPPISTEQVSKKVIEKIKDEKFSGIVTLDEMSQ